MPRAARRGRKKSAKRKPKKEVKKKKKRKKGKKKDPNAPKRAQSAYFLYMGSVRDQVRAAYPEYKIGDVTKHIGAMWRQLDPRKREPFEKEARKLKAQYHRDREEYLQNKHDPRKPKRPQSAYFLYMGDVRGEVKRKNPNFSIGEVAKEIGRRWRELSATKKGPYEKKAAKLKAKYWEDKAQYEAELAEEEE